MKSKMNRALSCLLTVLLLLTTLPVSALAEGNLKTELGITAEDVTVTEISEENKAALSKAASDRSWGIYTSDEIIKDGLMGGRIYSACHINSTDSSHPLTITMDEPTLIEADKTEENGWVVLALVDGELVTYPTEEATNGKLSFTVRLGENGTDIALSYLTNVPYNAVGDWGTLELEPGDMIKHPSLGYVREYELKYTVSEHITQYLKSMHFPLPFDLTFYLNSTGLKIDKETISFGENNLFQLDPEQTDKVSDGCYKFTARIDTAAWKAGDFTNVVGISYAAPNASPLLFEGEMKNFTTGSIVPYATMMGCVPLAITVVETESTNTYYKITVTQSENGEISPRGVENEVWVKEGECQTFTITPDQGYHIEDVVVNSESQGAITKYTFENVTDNNNTITATFAENPAVTITPANLTIYEGGDAGYEGVVDEDGDEILSTSFPEPLFKIDMPEGSEADPTDLTFTNNTSGNSWEVQVAGTDSEGTTYYRLVNTNESGNPIRVQFKDEDSKVIESDTVTTTNELYGEYTIGIFSDENDVVTAAAGETVYNIAASTGTLTVRAVQDTDATSGITDEAPTKPLSTGAATAVAPADTAYTIGETGVTVLGGAPSLLFDNIIDDGTHNRTAALTKRIEQDLGDDTNVYEIKYLDLVDANNGNAWITASEPVDIYWGYPDGTTQDTKFTVVHFKDLHRDGDNSGFATDDIANCEIETIQPVNTEQGIKFTVQPGQFSPFALVDAQAYTITATAGANGSISPSGAVTVTAGEDQTFTITPNRGYHIQDVLVDGVSVGAVSSYPFEAVAEDHTITATFAKDADPVTRYRIEASAGEGGSISPEGIVRVSQGGSQSFTITPDEGYRIEDVLVDGESVGPVSEYTFKNVRAWHTITVTFAKLPADPGDTGVSDWLDTEHHMAYLNGYPGQVFGPDRDMTRAEAAQMFYNLLLDKDVAGTASFTDVSADAWYAEAVNTLASLGMIQGVEGNRFQPDRAITRAEFTAIAMRFTHGEPTGENRFSDVNPDQWFYDVVVGAVQYGWINGYEDGTFRPESTIKRAEVAAITNRMLARAADETYVDTHAGQLRLFTDVAKDHWAYYAIVEASNPHDYQTNHGNENWKDA